MSDSTHLSRLNGRLIEVHAREAAALEALTFTRSEAEALEAEILHLSRGTGPAAVWNLAVPAGSEVWWSAGPLGRVATVTRSRAWMSEDGEPVVTVQGSTLPVPLADVLALELTS